MGASPALGVVHATVTEPLAADEELMVGVPGSTAVGVKLAGLEGDPAPSLLTAVTVTE